MSETLHTKAPVGAESGSEMRVELKALKNNPKRDFIVDPIDNEMVKRLAESIEQDGFWGGVVCRKHNGSIEIAAGHHRVKAAIKAGHEYADLFVGKNIDDAAMIRIYARENATQRSAAGTSLAGSVAAAFREVLRESVMNVHDESRGEGLGVDEFGADAIMKFLPRGSFPMQVITDQIATLKASGDYARMALEVAKEIKRDYPENTEAIERAQQIAEHLDNKHNRTFDFARVAKHLPTPHHLNVFRKLVTGEGIKPFLGVEQQHNVAKAIVEKAEELGAEVNERFIRENVYDLARDVKQTQRELTAAEIREMKNRSWQNQWTSVEQDFVSGTSQMIRAAQQLAQLDERRPKGTTAISFLMKQAVKNAEEAVALLKKVVT